MPRPIATAQLSLFEDDASASARSSTTFADNLSLPVHRWFRYSAGFSALWVRDVIRTAGPGVRVLDPFAGSGTVLVEAAELGAEAIGVESHPFVARIARVKTQTALDAEGYHAYIQTISKRSARIVPSIDNYPALIRKCYPDEQLGELDQLRAAWSETADNPYYDHGWLTLAAILRQCSPVGTANWQYVLPNKTKANVAHPLSAFKAKGRQIAADMQGRTRLSHPSVLLQDDAREMTGVPDGWATLVVTSPPYPNNFDYADATRLEMSFFGDVAGWSGLQDSVRKHLVRSCTQHVSPIVPLTKGMVAASEVAVIHEELKDVCDRLEAERLNHGGKKNYHTMVAALLQGRRCLRRECG